MSVHYIDDQDHEKRVSDPEAIKRGSNRSGSHPVVAPAGETRRNGDEQVNAR